MTSIWRPEDHIAYQNNGRYGAGKWAFDAAPAATQQKQKQPSYGAQAGGKAQSMQPPGQGAPYSAYAPPGAGHAGGATGSSGMGATYTGGRPPQRYAFQTQPTRTTPATYTPGAGLGNMAYAPPDQRPPPFTATYRGPDGAMSTSPPFAQRDAFIQQINEQDGRRIAAGGGPASYNLPQMWNQAGNMVQRGWQNPLAGLFGDITPEAIGQPMQGPLRGFVY